MLSASLLWKLVGLAAVDSVNPCTIYVYTVLLLATSVRVRSPHRVLLVGLAFVGAVFVGYLLVGLGVAAASYAIPLWALGAAAIVYGVVVVTGATLEARGKSLVFLRPGRLLEKRVLLASGDVLASAGLGLLASFTLLPCSSGPLLAFITLARAEGVSLLILLMYLVLYNTVFVAPLLAIAFSVAYTYKYKKIQRLVEEHSTLLTLVSGLLLITVGVYVIADALW